MTRIIKTYYLLMAFLAVALMLHSCAADNAMRKGEKFLAIGEYHDAAEQFKKAYTKKTAFHTIGLACQCSSNGIT